MRIVRHVAGEERKQVQHLCPRVFPVDLEQRELQLTTVAAWLVLELVEQFRRRVGREELEYGAERGKQRGILGRFVQPLDGDGARRHEA